MTRPIEQLDVQLADVEAHMAEQKAIAVLWTARVRSGEPRDRIAYALDARLIETRAAVATDRDYPEWAARLAAQPTYHHAKKKGAQ
jgi:hypothetical protein